MSARRLSSRQSTGPTTPVSSSRPSRQTPSKSLAATPQSQSRSSRSLTNEPATPTPAASAAAVSSSTPSKRTKSPKVEKMATPVSESPAKRRKSSGENQSVSLASPPAAIPNPIASPSTSASKSASKSASSASISSSSETSSSASSIDLTSQFFPSTAVESFLADFSNAIEDYSSSCLTHLLQIALQTAPKLTDSRDQLAVADAIRSLHSRLQLHLSSSLDIFEIYTKRNIFTCSNINSFDSSLISSKELLKSRELEIHMESNQLDIQLKLAKEKYINAKEMNEKLKREYHSVQTEIEQFNSLKSIFPTQRQSVGAKFQDSTITQVTQCFELADSLQQVAVQLESAAKQMPTESARSSGTRGRLRADQTRNPVATDAAAKFLND